MPESVSEKPLPASQSLVGQLIADRYRVEKLVGEGGMGSVYRATHVQLRKTVALKVLHTEMTRYPEAVARFEREAIAASRIDHQNVAVATDFGRLEDGTFYLVLEYVEGESLRDRLWRDKRFTPEFTLDIAQQIASALRAAHAHNIVHRDLKPENVMLITRAGQPTSVKVLDFGIAKVPLEENPEGITAIGSVLGTPSYMSPEQCAGRLIDARSDLYSLGVILYEAVNGRKPFEADDPLAMLSHHLASAPAPMEPDVPPHITSIILRLLEKDPDQRIQSAQDLLDIFAAASRESRELELQTAAAAHAKAAKFAAVGTRVRRAGSVMLEVARHGFKWLEVQGKRRVRFPNFGVQLLGWRLELPRWLVAVIGAVLVAAVFVPWHPPSGSGSGAPSGSGSANAGLDSALPKGTRDEFQQQVERIEMLKTYERTERDWVLLARGYAELGQWVKCAQAYRAVLSLHPSLNSDPLLLSDLQLAAQDPEAFKIVLNLSETVLGVWGVDLIWLIWRQIRNVEDQAENAEKLRKKLIVLSQSARPALRVAIELDYYQKCPNLEGVVKRAAKYADNRSLAPLELLKRTTGCGPRQEFDCTPCVRGEGILEKAIERAKETSPPPLGGD
jgi:eukaryotic-like serine/threonine-protein kinase